MRTSLDVKTDDLLLWKQLIEGDKQAYSTLFVRFYDNLYAYSLKLTKEDDLSHDIVQELFVNLWVSRHKLKPVSNLKPYLLRCVKNLIIDYLRRSKTIERTNLNIIQEEIVFSQEDFRISSEETIAQTAKVMELLNALPGRVKEAIYLRYFSGLDYNEIANVMDINVQSAQNFVHRGIRQMKEVYLIFLAIVPYNM
jgi:RNA polymerase sigma factor (sigma-70 family)